VYLVLPGVGRWGGADDCHSRRSYFQDARASLLRRLSETRDPGCCVCRFRFRAVRVGAESSTTRQSRVQSRGWSVGGVDGWTDEDAMHRHGRTMHIRSARPVGGPSAARTGLTPGLSSDLRCSRGLLPVGEALVLGVRCGLGRSLLLGLLRGRRWGSSPSTAILQSMMPGTPRLPRVLRFLGKVQKKPSSACGLYLRSSPIHGLARG
jgi:hypothetical protein